MRQSASVLRTSRPSCSSALDVGRAAAGFAALGAPARLRIVQELVRRGHEGLSVGQIRQRTAIPASTLAHHLGFLNEAGLIVQEKRGRVVLNRAAYAHLEELAGFLLNECCAEERDGGAVRGVKND